jgi:uncharacterized protein YuzE
MKITYSPEADIAYIKLGRGKYDISHEKEDGVVVDVSKSGKIIGFEIMYASKTMPQIVRQFEGAKKFKELNFAVA